LDFVARREHNQRWSAALVAAFILFFLFIGGAVDYLYFDAFTPTGPPVPLATIFSLGLATTSTLAAYYGGSDMILSSLGAQKLNPKIPEHRELQNVVTEMALASGAAMPRLFVIFDPAPNAFATGTNETNAAICVTSGLLALLDREETQGVLRTRSPTFATRMSCS
jgi:heat shock protein HtpX